MTAVRIRIAAQQTPGREDGAPEEAPFTECLDGVLGAARVIFTALGDKRRNEPAIEADHRNRYFFKSVFSCIQVSPLEQVVYHCDDLFVPALLQEVRQSMSGDNYIVIVGRGPGLEFTEDFLEHPLDLVAHHGAADFLRNRHSQTGNIVFVFR